jgi:F-type H+-transporting ATPase subunit b
MSRVRWIIAALAVAMYAGIASAAEERGAHGASLTSLFLPIINFATFVGLFVYFAWPLIVSALADRRRLVVKEIAEADQVHREAAAMLDEIRTRSGRLAEDGARLERELRAEAERDRRRVVDEARQTAERIRADARLVAEQEAARAAKRIREQVADQVIDRVVGLLRERLTPADEERFVREFGTAVEQGDLR